jgi:hypothetical protein
LWANGSGGSNGQVLVTNGSAIYWGTGTSGANTQVQFNDSGVANATAGFTFNKVSNNLTVSNTIISNSAELLANISSSNTTTGTLKVTGGVGVTGRINTGDLAAGNDSVYSSLTGTTLTTVNVVATNISGNGASITSVNAATVGGNTAADLRTYTDNKAANAYSNATSYADTAAGTAYSNAASYADAKAANAYSNAVSYTDNKAANAYSNAMSDTLSRNGTYTGNNIFQGTNTVFSSNVVISNYVSSNVIPSSNNTYHLGNSSLRWAQIHAANVHAVTGKFDGNVEVSGDLIVAGNVTTTNVNSLVVSDPLIYLAGNNNSSDLLDIGFAANYYDGNNRHTGLFRDHTDGIWKLFFNLTQELSGNNDIDTSDATYRTATLQAYLQSSALSTNSTSVSITANSTVAVSITANSLTLSSPLSGTSGGTGLNSYTAEDILVANSSNGFRKLGLGTSGYILQSNGSALVYDTLDGGTF